MTRRFTFLILALFALIAGPGWGQEQTVTMSYSGSTTTNMTGNNDAATVGLNASSWSVVASKGGNNNFPGLNKAGQIRLYGAATNHNVITVTNLDEATITTIKITYGSSNYNAKVTVGGSEVTGTGSNTEKNYNINSSSFSIAHNYDNTTQVYILSIEINYSTGTPSTDPAINANGEKNLAYNETSGSIPYTISNPVDGVELEASLEEGATWITDLAVGDESVTFNTTANDSYDSRSAEITLSYEGADDVVVTVNQDGKPVPTINADNITIEQDATSGTIEYTIANPIEGQNLTAEITTGDWISNLAVDAENNQVTFDAAVNTGEARTATVTLKYMGATDKVVTVTQKKFTVDYATLPFNWAGGGKSGLLALDGVTSNGLGSDYAESNAPYRIKFDDDGDYIQFKTIEAIGTITIGVKMIGGNNTSSIAIKGSSDGENFSDVETLTISGSSNAIVNLETTEILDASYRYVRMVFNKGSNVGVGPISIAKAETAYTVSIAQGIENGSISVSPTSAIAGRTITIEPTPFDGYVLDHYTISKTEDGTDVTDIVHLDGNTFTMPAYDVTISATFTLALSYTVTIAANIQHGEIISVENEYAEGATVQLMVEPAANYGLASWSITKDADGSDTEIVPVYNSEAEAYEFTMPAYDITVSATFGKIATYTRITSIDQLIVGRPYIIVGKKNDKYYTMGSQGDNNNRPAIEIDADETTARWFESDILHEFFISGDADNHYSIYDELNQNPYTHYGFLYAASNSSNHLKTEETLDDNGKWAIGFDETGAASVVAQGTNTRKVMQFNSSSTLFSCYASSSQSPVYIYMKDNPFIYNIFSNTYIDGDYNIPSYTMFTLYEGAKMEVTGSINSNGFTFSMMEGTQLIHNNNIYNGWFYCPIIKYAESETNERTGWNLVALPINDYNMVAGTTIPSNGDLYSYDESIHFWINEKPNNPETYIPLQLGKGYLFALPEDSPSRFGSGGTLQPSNVGLSFPLSYASIDGRLKGFNLVGNPFTCNAYVNMPFMVLDETGSTFIPGNVIKPGDAILVQATAEGQEITFTRNAPTEPENRLDISVSQNRGSIIDNTRIRFGGSHAMNKFYLNENSTRLYIPQDGQDFAIVSSSTMEGELPVNFKAEKNGTYTITVNTKNVDAEYLHLIDNMTGMDIDLLATDSYTFDALANDYAYRFKLVFGMTGVEENALTSSANFAYISNGNLVIDNIECETTLKIVDELGRIISTETVNGSYNKALNLKAGLYIINLNGMTQKIVVE